MPHPLLETLVEHPLLSAEQLGVMYAAHPNTVRGELKGLIQDGFVAKINPRSPELETRAVFYPTPKGVREIARACSNKIVLSSQRMIALWLVLERVYFVRNFLLLLERPYAVQTWDVEVKKQFRRRNQLRTLNLHATGIAQADGCLTPFVVEWDMGILALERQRLARWVEWNWTIRLSDANLIRPVFLILASDAPGLERYYAELRAAAFARNLPITQTYLAIKSTVFRNQPTAPIWYLAETGKRTRLFDGLQDHSAKSNVIAFVDLQSKVASRANQGKDLNHLPFDESHPTPLTSIAALKRDLTPQAKSVLNEIGAHPMLSKDDLAELLRAARKRVLVSLTLLENWKLIQVVRSEQEARFVLTEVGVAYLAAVNGFGRCTRKYATARGWKRGTSMLVRHWQHTRTENEFFMQIVRVAQASGARFIWLSELECRLYYAASGRRWSYLPDGGGIYQAHGVSIQFALEMDRGNVSHKRWRKRLSQYHAYLDSARLRTTEREKFRLLVITTTWTRAKNLGRTALQTALMRQSRVLPMWITTLDSVQVRDVSEPIWR
ncbi:MAG TPA: replication-relaxation family protein, partial [Anaerolineae bacterium]|nr:replication-relaxation family protein [Anaerolineae bacterium]